MMTIKVIGLIHPNDPNAFEEYRSQVGQTLALYQGTIASRGSISQFFWNELKCAPFSAFVELELPDLECAQSWAHSPNYQHLLPTRSKAMKLTLFSVST